MRRVSFTGRLSFAAASRWTPRRLPLSPERGLISFSFDDIPRTAWTAGGAILGRYGVRGTYYLSGDLCGGVFEGRDQFRRDDVADIRAAGHEIGSHLFHHVSTLGLSVGQMRREIAANDDFLEEVIGPGFRAQSFAYPYGEVSVTAKWLCSRRFKASRSVRGGLNHSGADRDQLRILAIDNLFATETDWSGIFASIAREKAWAIVLAHGVDDSDHPFSCPPERLDAAVRGAMEAGLEILPVAEVMERLSQTPT